MEKEHWEDVREEVCTYLEIGASYGESELDIMTRLIWLERQNNLVAIKKAVDEAIDRERGNAVRKAKVLPWKLSRTSAPHLRCR